MSGLTAEHVTAGATAGAALLAAAAAWSARRAAGAAEASAHAAADLVELERARFAVEQTDRAIAELGVSYRRTKGLGEARLLVTNAGPAAAFDVVAVWTSHDARFIGSSTLKADRLAPGDDLEARVVVAWAGDHTAAVRVVWRDSRGEHEREESVTIL